MHLELIFMYDVWYSSRFIFFHMNIQLTQYNLLKGILSALQCSVTIVMNQVDIYVWTYL